MIISDTLYPLMIELGKSLFLSLSYFTRSWLSNHIYLYLHLWTFSTIIKNIYQPPQDILLKLSTFILLQWLGSLLQQLYEDISGNRPFPLHIMLTQGHVQAILRVMELRKQIEAERKLSET